MIQRLAVRRRRSTRVGTAVRGGAALTVLAVVAASAVLSTPAHAQPVNPHSVTVSIVDVSPSTPPASATPRPLTVTLSLTNNTDQTLPNVRVVGARGDPIGSRTALDTAISHVQPPDPNQVSPMSPQKPVLATIGPRASLSVAFTTLTSTDYSSSPGLCICQNRIYPLYFSVHAHDVGGGDVVVGTAETFVPAFGETVPAPVQVSWVWPLIDRPHRVVGDTNFIDDDLAYLIAGGRLDRALEVVERVAARSIAMTLIVDPELIDELAVMASGTYTVTVNGKSTRGTGTAAAQLWLARLRSALTIDPKLELDFTPLADPDVESLSRNGLQWTTGLSPEVRSRIATALGGRTPGTSVAWPVDGLLSSPTLDSLVRSGATSVIVSDASLPSTAGPDATTNQLGTLQTSAGQISAAVTQHSIQRYVAPTVSTGNTPAQLAQLVSEVAVAAISSAQSSPFVVITAPREVSPDNPAIAARAIIDTADTLWSTSLTLGVAAHSVAPSDHAQLVPPSGGQGQLSDLTISAARSVSKVVPALATMMSTADASQVLGSLPTAVQRAESSAWRSDPNAGNDFAAQLQRRINSIESGVRIVRPSAGTYTLTSANSPLPVTVENDLGVTVKVRVDLSSQNDLPGFTAKRIGLQTIAPNTKVTLHIATHVDRAGRFRVQAVLVTPNNVPIGQPILVSVHSTALGAIGVVITIVAAVVLVLALLIRFIRKWRHRAAMNRTTVTS